MPGDVLVDELVTVVLVEPRESSDRWWLLRRLSSSSGARRCCSESRWSNSRPEGPPR